MNEIVEHYIELENPPRTVGVIKLPNGLGVLKFCFIGQEPTYVKLSADAIVALYEVLHTFFEDKDQP